MRAHIAHQKRAIGAEGRILEPDIVALGEGRNIEFGGVLDGARALQMIERQHNPGRAHIRARDAVGHAVLWM